MDLVAYPMGLDLYPDRRGVGGYKPEFGSIAQAEYATELEQKAAAARKGRLARIARALRRLFWEF